MVISIFQILDVVFNLTMDALMYFHHQGQFFSQDSDQKVLVPKGKKLFLDVRHEIFQSYQKKREENDEGNFNVTCIQEYDYSYSQCIQKVSILRILLS